MYKSFPLRSCKSYLRNCKFSYPENEADLVLSPAGIFETPKDIDGLQFAPIIDQISVLGGVVDPIVDVESLKKYIF